MKPIFVLFACIQSIIAVNEHKLILISFDGFRNDYFSEKDTPNLFKFAKNGVWGRNMISTFTTKTFPNHFSIVTGYYQETHGIVNNVIFDPIFNETFSMSSRGNKWWENGLSIPIWVANQMVKNDQYSYVSMWPGSWEEIHGRRPHYSEPYVEKSNFEKRIEKMIAALSRKRKPANLAVMYFDEPDQTSHHYGPFSKETREKIKIVDNLVDFLIKRLEKANLANQANIIILSDHGMAEVAFENMIDLNKIADTSCFRVFGSAPVLNILAKEGKKELVYEMLKKASIKNHFNVYQREEVPREYHYSNHRRILDFVIEAHEGYYVDTVIEKWFRGQKAGVHGYNNSLFSMRPLFLASGPAFKKQFIYDNLFENIDLYPLMCKILDLNLAEFPSNGTFNKVKALLKEF
ncbi:ectonucleotide pyrophosphatase/phosphodiesterase family member 5-like isoform X2 [Dinothrombium tinctorium]|uniref:Ectonucleotide pyrophosphatase/phosphodiesterase family member 5-like isoform X2 n=1 Tax=Dinothrombium tinctorium TaxID=1965070 RepID=A0A443QMU3_9ACAR|nr:ectonucleotide pyrophosphatase/phosphodiesterase family member 5-like isoform X2 [Dinothrombium tinctorium]